MSKVKHDLAIVHNLSQDLILLNELELGAITGQKISTLRANRIKGKGCPFYKIGGLVRYKLVDVMKYIEGCKRLSTSDSNCS
jgi:hypothetical protein